VVKPSSSPQRNSFQRERYIKRQTEKGEIIRQDYLDLFDTMLKEQETKFDDPKSKENNLEYDLLTTDWILEKVRESNSYAQNLYAAMCNNDFQKLDLWPILKEEKWHCSWRYAGGIIADMQQRGDYIDWYCSGMGGLNGAFEQEAGESFEQWQSRTKYVPESIVTIEIAEDLKKLGWVVLKQDDNFL
jgi:hypothetical protein